MTIDESVQQVTGIEAADATDHIGIANRDRSSRPSRPYLNLAGTIADLRTRGYRFLSCVNPFVAQRLRPLRAERLVVAPGLSIPAAREFVKGFFRAMVDVYGITRSGWTGDKVVTQIHWVGDQEADWSPFDGLPTVVPAMLNLGISRVPYVTHDIAGFSGGPSTKELYLRWTELGAFTPYMRTHQGGKELLNWSWKSDAETSAHFARFARIHRALAPEFQALAAAAATTAAPIGSPPVFSRDVDRPDLRAIM